MCTATAWESRVDIVLTFLFVDAATESPNTTWDEKAVPNGPKPILDAMAVKPSEATDDHTKLLEVVYKIALPAVCGKAEQVDLEEKGCGLIRLLDDRWPFEVATAIVLLLFCSDTANIRHNVEVDARKNLSYEDKTKERRRVHLLNNAATAKATRMYFALVTKLRSIQATTESFENVETWERSLLVRAKKNGAPERMPTVPGNKLSQNMPDLDQEQQYVRTFEDRLRQESAQPDRMDFGDMDFQLFAVDELSDQEDKENTDPNVNANVNVNMAQV